MVRPYRRNLVVAIAVSIAALGAQVNAPLVVKRYIDEAIRGNRPQSVIPYALVIFGLGLAQAVMWFVRRNLLGSAAVGLENDLRNRLYGHLQALPVSFHDGWQSGQLVSRAVSDISRIRRFLGFGLSWLVILAVQFAWITVLLFRLDVGLAITTIAFSAPVALMSYRFSRRFRKISRDTQDQQGDLTTVIEEVATGVRVIKSYGRSRERSEIFSRQALKLREITLVGVSLRAKWWSLNTILLNTNLVVILLFGGLRVVNGGLSLGALVAFIQFQLMLVWPVRDVGWILSNGQEASAAAERVFEILDTPADVADLPGATPLPTPAGRLAFEGVRFTYPGTRSEVLKGVDFRIEPGETLALVGSTGSGKTTLASLVSRFYDPDGGRVSLDERDLKSLTLDSLRSHVGVAFEDPILFSASVRENLLMGSPDASDDDLWDALAAAQADVFVRNLPWGLDTRVGEQGYSLSGGQRQRLALARAVVGRPRVLVLDNPMSSVDVHTEALIEEALKSILQGRTALLIAYRPSTLLLADRVALLHEGRIVATGTHHDLLSEVPLYREMLAKDVADPFAAEEVNA
ncbi:MAG TPA: ABC transporter ATP-binding protein [Actinomycetota bacterium]|nr:ABC transporter ATP-binding protein [Actinomycetota bacterium]